MFSGFYRRVARAPLMTTTLFGAASIGLSMAYWNRERMMALAESDTRRSKPKRDEDSFFRSRVG